MAATVNAEEYAYGQVFDVPAIHVALAAARGEGAAQALRDAADALHDVSLPQDPYERRWAIAEWLRTRADAAWVRDFTPRWLTGADAEAGQP